MADDLGLRDWSPGSVAHDLSAAIRPYYRDIPMPGGFPFTPQRESSPVFERNRSATGDGGLLGASKRFCTTATRAARAFSNTTSTSMTTILRNLSAMQRMPFRLRHASRSENRTRCETQPVTTIAPSIPTSAPVVTEIVLQHTQEPASEPQPKIQLASPFTILKPTYGIAKRLPSPVREPDSSPDCQLHEELDAADEDSDASSTYDGKWIPIPAVPVHQIRPEQVTPLSSELLDTQDWYHDGYEWSRFGRTQSPPTTSTVKSRAEVIEDDYVAFRHTRRTLLKAKKALGDTSKFDIKPLSKEWDANVNAALKNGHGRLQARDFQKIVPPDAETGTGAWLNDESINEYLGLITDHANRDVKGKATPRMHAMSTFFFTSLRSGGYQKVARWAKRANIAGTALLDVEKIFIPINPNQSHWTLAVIQPRIQRITHYNSFGSGNKAYLDTICEWLKGELGAGFVRADWELDFRAESPQQTNTSDCGVFTVTTAKQLMLGLDPMTYGPRDIPTQRKRMVAELVNGKLLGAD